MGCGGTKDRSGTKAEMDEAGDSSSDLESEAPDKKPKGGTVVRKTDPNSPTSFDGLVMCTLAAMLRLCEQLKSSKHDALVAQANKLLKIIKDASCPQPWQYYLESRPVRDATFEIINKVTQALQTDDSLSKVQETVDTHHELWKGVNPAGAQSHQPIKPLQEILLALVGEDDLKSMDKQEIEGLERMVHDSWIEIGVLTLAHYAYSTAKHVAKTLTCAACGEVGEVTLSAVLRGESVVSSELEALWGEITLMKQTVLALEAGADVAQEKARKSLTLLQMSKSQAGTVQMLVKAVRAAKAGERPGIVTTPTALASIGYLLVELHCRGYANGAAIVQRAALLLSQIAEAPAELSEDLKIKLNSIHVRLDTLRRFLSIDVTGSEDLEEQLVALKSASGSDHNRFMKASAMLRRVVGERGRMLAVQPVQRAETVIALPWELGSSAEYGHLNLLYKILNEAEKLDIAEHNAEVGDVHLPQATLKAVTQRIESLKWEKSHMYEKVQSALSVLDLFNIAKSVIGGEADIDSLNQAYSKLAHDPDLMDYATSCGHATYDPCNMHPVLEVFTTINRIQRGKLSLDKLKKKLVAAWPAVYDLIVDGLAMASANRISQMFDATLKGSIGVNNLMVLLRSERAMLNELQADMMGLLSWTHLNTKLDHACSNSSGAFELEEAAAACNACLESSRTGAVKAGEAVTVLQTLCNTASSFMNSKKFDQSSQEAVLNASKLLIEQRIAGYRSNELAQLVVSLELKSVRQPDIDAVKPMLECLKIKAGEPEHIGRILRTIEDFQEATGPIEVQDEADLELSSNSMRLATAKRKDFQQKLSQIRFDWLVYKRLDEAATRLGVCLRGDMPDSAEDYYKDSLRVAFLELDRDHDGSITLSELEAWIRSSFWQEMPPLLQNLNPSSDTSEIRKVFKAMDLDGDGVVSFDEFRALLENEVHEAFKPKKSATEKLVDSDSDLDDDELPSMGTKIELDKEEEKQYKIDVRRSHPSAVPTMQSRRNSNPPANPRDSTLNV